MNMKKRMTILLAIVCCLALVACGQSAPAETTAAPAAQTEAETTVPETTVPETTAPALPDGTYTAEFNTDSSMFHANETCDGKGTLYVQDGKMTLHVSLASTSIVNLYPGLAEDAQKEGAVLLEPTKDEVVYPDGLTETVNGFDIPVPYLDEEFDLALIGKKGTWYDHKVSVSNPVKEEGDAVPVSDYEDGAYTVELTLTGGTGKATVQSPANLTVSNGTAVLTLVWSSDKYDYMIVEGEKYLPVSTEGGATFEIPMEKIPTELAVVADTVAMSTPHEIEYTITLTDITKAE